VRTTAGKKVTMYIPITGYYTEMLLKSRRDLGFKEDDHTWFKEKSRLLKNKFFHHYVICFCHVITCVGILVFIEVRGFIFEAT
jgi:hypothetical protein